MSKVIDTYIEVATESNNFALVLKYMWIMREYSEDDEFTVIDELMKAKASYGDKI